MNQDDRPSRAELESETAVDELAARFSVWCREHGKDPEADSSFGEFIRDYEDWIARST